MKKVDFLKEKMLNSHKEAINMTGATRFKAMFIFIQDIENYYRELKFQTSIKLTESDLLLQQELRIIEYQFEIDILKEVFNTKHQELSNIWDMPSQKSQAGEIKLELLALNSEIISKTDFVENLINQYNEHSKKGNT